MELCQPLATAGKILPTIAHHPFESEQDMEIHLDNSRFNEALLSRPDSPMCNNGFPFHSTVLGLEGVFAKRCQPFAHDRIRPQPSAATRNRPQLFASVHVVPLASGDCCKKWPLVGFQAAHSFVLCGIS